MLSTDLSCIDPALNLEVANEEIFHTHIAAYIQDLIPIARWGTRGKDGKDPVKFVKLIDCEDEHLEAILTTQFALSQGYKLIIETILQIRKAQNRISITATHE